MNGSNMGGPAGMPMMNNGAAGGGPQAHPGNDSRTRLNTYIYEYFLKNEQWDCARAILSCDLQLQVNSNSVKNSPGRRRDENGNPVNGADDHMDGDVKGEGGIKRPDDLPAPDIPEIGDSTFLYDWWCLFWDMYGAQRNKSDSRPQTLQYLNHTQVCRCNYAILLWLTYVATISYETRAAAADAAPDASWTGPAVPAYDDEAAAAERHGSAKRYSAKGYAEQTKCVSDKSDQHICFN